MAKNKDKEIPKGPDAPSGTQPDANRDGNKPKPAKTVPGVCITAKVASFRRAGLAFGLTPVDMPLFDLSEEQLAALKAEPMLTVEEIEIQVGV